MFIPFKVSAVTNVQQSQSDRSLWEVDLRTLGIPLAGVVTHEDGAVHVEELRHPWESLASSFTPLAFKVFHREFSKRLMPGVEIKASPAKLLQGHNVFGPTSIRKGAEVMLLWLQLGYPKLFDLLDIPATEVYSFDATYSARLPDEKTALQVIQFLSGVTNGQTKNRGDNYQTTCYWGAKDSRIKRLKCYLKYIEFDLQREEMRRQMKYNLSASRTYRAMSDPRLLDWVKYLLRFEATVMRRWMERRQIPTRLIDLMAYQEQLAGQGRCFIQECWQETTKDIFAALEGMTMRLVDDEKVLAALIAKHTRITKSGKKSDSYARNLFRTYRSLKEFGWEETLSSMSRPSFYRHISDIQQCGLSKAALQKLQQNDRTNNVVPLLRFVQVDFTSQRPDWYVEPSVEFAA
jgi:II/X family phage/plasmid replication protein